MRSPEACGWEAGVGSAGRKRGRVHMGLGSAVRPGHAEGPAGARAALSSQNSTVLTTVLGSSKVAMRICWGGGMVMRLPTSGEARGAPSSSSRASYSVLMCNSGWVALRLRMVRGSALPRPAGDSGAVAGTEGGEQT